MMFHQQSPSPGLFGIGSGMVVLYFIPACLAIMEFDKWQRQWESTVSGKDMPISTSTLTGFKVTLGATLELIEALRIESNYEFLMTARLNQDALERFFGMMRGACGSNDHPDPQLFAQVFRLLCSYSLIKPAKGSNVSGTELLQVLMQTEDSLAMSKKPRSEWLNRIDRLLEDSDTGDCDRKSHEQDHNYEASATMTCSEWNESVHDHTYDVARTSPQVQTYIAGYVVRRMRRRLKCDDCINALQSHDNEPGDANHKMIDMMNQYGGLIHPSDALFYLTETLESIVLDVVGKFGVKIDTFQTIIEKLSELKGLPAIGCVDHHKETTRKIIDFYMIMRGHFLTESFNKNNNDSRQRTKKLRKNAKL